MDDVLVRRFMQLAGQRLGTPLHKASPELRKLGAQLLLSEVLEYVTRGLGVTPEVNGVAIEDANGLEYRAHGAVDEGEAIDGIADVAYTMYWNSCAFGLPLSEAYELVAQNNLDKFVKLKTPRNVGSVDRNQWDLGQEISWPAEVEHVEILAIDGDLYGVGKDKHGKVRKPSSYAPVDLSSLIKGDVDCKGVVNG